MATALAAAGASVIVNPELHAQQPAAHGRRLATVKSPLSGSDSPNTWEHLTTYNNFYEFGTGKNDPALNARGFKPKAPWTITIEGECARPGTLNLEDVLKGQALEDRIYRHRCVEGWSMVIPWVGFPLAALIKLRAHLASRVRRVHDAARPPSDAGAGATCSSGRMSRAAHG
jgi:sulfoxide reductase catalytic subunit YedY